MPVESRDSSFHLPIDHSLASHEKEGMDYNTMGFQLPVARLQVASHSNIQKHCLGWGCNASKCPAQATYKSRKNDENTTGNKQVSAEKKLHMPAENDIE